MTDQSQMGKIGREGGRVLLNSVSNYSLEKKKENGRKKPHNNGASR